jgi:nucleoside-diphosphate-sugar epimerase
MGSDLDQGLILITGASGHIGSELCSALRADRRHFLPVDVVADPAGGIFDCDLRIKDSVRQLFVGRRVRTVIHLAGMLPSAFLRDPLAGAAVNLCGTIDLLQAAVNAGVKRFVFASSMSVYGSVSTNRPLTESDVPAPGEPYGASKRAVELIGEALAKQRVIEFVSLRVARVVGPGIKKTSSPWRSQIFEPTLETELIRIPFAPDAKLSLVHVEEVARMLDILASAPVLRELAYNTPAETWLASALKHTVEELFAVRVELDADHGSPLCDGSQFAREFDFQLRGLQQRLEGVSPRWRSS